MAEKIDHMKQAIALLAEAGYVEDGQTAVENVRIPTVRSPVFGGVGGEAATFGGRARFRQPGTPKFVTVGKRSVCFYEKADGKTSNYTNFDTKDAEGIRSHLFPPAAPAP